jgi:DNA-binding MarR family transcriptional regulator
VTGEGFDVAVLAAPVRLAEAERAVLLAGGRVTTTLGWDAVAALGERVDGRAVLLVEAEGVAPSMLTTALPGLADTADLLDLRLVVTLAVGQIDEIAAVLMGPSTQLLCEPTLAELVAAIAIAVAGQMGGSPGLADRWREDEAERLRRLNDEVARIAELLARLVGRERERDGGGGDEVGDRHIGFGFAPPATDADPQAIRQAIRARRLRDAFFGQNLFEDPAWDMLLDLYAAHLEGGQVSVSSLCIAAAVAPTTALRWIGKLTGAGLLERQPDPLDRRRAFMALSAKALRGMEGYVAAVRRAGLPIG